MKSKQTLVSAATLAAMTLATVSPAFSATSLPDTGSDVAVSSANLEYGDPAASDDSTNPEKVQTGNDPSDFGWKINPYYTFDSIHNGAEISSVYMFAMMPFKLFGKVPASIVIEGAAYQEINTNNVTSIPAAFRGTTSGLGDFVIRMPFMLPPTHLPNGWIWAHVPLPEFTMPTGSDGLSDDRWVFSPGYAAVIADPDNPRWFLALAQFYDFDIHKQSSGAKSVSRLRARWFFQYMLSPEKKIYSMTELQASFDFNSNHESFWLSPEFGKVWNKGLVTYIKPGIVEIQHRDTMGCQALRTGL